MRVLVTGGTGFVGCHTVARLMKDGRKIRLLVRSKRRVPWAVGPLGLSSSSVEVVLGDVTDRDSVKRALSGMDAFDRAYFWQFSR